MPSVPNIVIQADSENIAPLCETAKSGFDFRVQECHTSMASMHHGGPGLGEAR